MEIPLAATAPLVNLTVPSNELQRVQGHRAAQDARVVQTEQGPAACRLRWGLAA